MERKPPSIVDDDRTLIEPVTASARGRKAPALDDDRPLRDGPSLRLRPADHKSQSMPRRRSLGRRALVWTLLALLAVTVLPVALLRVVPAWTSSFMVRYQIERALAGDDRPALRHQWVSWSRISATAKLAVIAAEDQRFAEHIGLDFRAIGKAIEHNRNNRRTRGASTITQQLAKNLFLWPDRSWVRKGLETGYTLLIELLWPKQRVLEVYLNVVEFGPGIYGVEAAAQSFFGKHATQLSPHEASLLAAVLPNPKRLRVEAPSDYVQNRAAWIRRQMDQIGAQTLEAL